MFVIPVHAQTYYLLVSNMPLGPDATSSLYREYATLGSDLRLAPSTIKESVVVSGKGSHTEVYSSTDRHVPLLSPINQKCLCCVAQYQFVLRNVQSTGKITPQVYQEKLLPKMQSHQSFLYVWKRKAKNAMLPLSVSEARGGIVDAVSEKRAQVLTEPLTRSILHRHHRNRVLKNRLGGSRQQLHQRRFCCLCGDGVHVEVVVATLETNHVLLAVVRGDAILTVVLKERVQTKTVDEDVPMGFAKSRSTRWGPKDAQARREWVLWGWTGIVEDAVFRRGTIEPDRTLRLDIDTTAVVNVDLVVVGKVKLVVSDPEPGILEINTRRLGTSPEEHVRAFTTSVDSSRRWILGTLVALQLCACTATNTHIGDLDRTGLASRADVKDRLRVTGVAEEAASRHDQWPDLTSHLDGVGNADGFADNISTMVEVQNLVRIDTSHGLLNGSSVIGNTITLSTEALDTDERAGGQVLVLGLGTLEEFTRTVKQGGRLGRSSERSLNTRTRSAGDRATISSGDGSGRAREINVVDDESTRSGRSAVGRERSLDTDRGVGQLGVHENDRANQDVGGATVGDIKTDTAVVDRDRLQGPCPVPVHEDGSVAVVEGPVARGELLIAQESSVVAAVEDEIAHETTRTIVHEDTDLLGSRARNHVEDDVLERSCLSDLPMDTCTSCLRHASQGDVTNLVCEHVCATAVIRIRVQNSHALETSSSLQSGHVERVSDELSVVQHDDGLRDHPQPQRLPAEIAALIAAVSRHTMSRYRMPRNLDAVCLLAKANACDGDSTKSKVTKVVTALISESGLIARIVHYGWRGSTRENAPAIGNALRYGQGSLPLDHSNGKGRRPRNSSLQQSSVVRRVVRKRLFPRRAMTRCGWLASRSWQFAETAGASATRPLFLDRTHQHVSLGERVRDAHRDRSERVNRSSLWTMFQQVSDLSY
ncbi:glucan 1,3-beta-glucosidase, partial [Aureobasidium melanogenum]